MTVDCVRVAKHLDMTPVAVMGSRKLPPVTTFDNNNLAPGLPGQPQTNTSQKGERRETGRLGTSQLRTRKPFSLYISHKTENNFATVIL